MRISDWSSDACSSDLFRTDFRRDAGIAVTAPREAQRRPLQRIYPGLIEGLVLAVAPAQRQRPFARQVELQVRRDREDPCLRLAEKHLCRLVRRGQRIAVGVQRINARSEEHTSEIQSLMRHSYAVFC